MNTIVTLIRFLHSKQGARVDDLCRELHCLPGYLYRLRNAARTTLQVEIEFFPDDPGGYRIVDYGIIDWRKLDVDKTI